MPLIPRTRRYGWSNSVFNVLKTGLFLVRSCPCSICHRLYYMLCMNVIHTLTQFMYINVSNFVGISSCAKIAPKKHRSKFPKAVSPAVARSIASMQETLFLRYRYNRLDTIDGDTHLSSRCDCRTLCQCLALTSSRASSSMQT